jgi:hypothetical protein
LPNPGDSGWKGRVMIKMRMVKQTALSPYKNIYHLSEQKPCTMSGERRKDIATI